MSPSAPTPLSVWISASLSHGNNFDKQPHKDYLDIYKCNEQYLFYQHFVVKCSVSPYKFKSSQCTLERSCIHSMFEWMEWCKSE